MVIGVDVGGTNIKFGLVDMDNNLVYDSLRATGSGQDEVIDNLVEIIDELGLMAKDKFNDRIEGIGIAVPGVVNKGLDTIFTAPNLGWNNLPLRDLIKERTSETVFIDNDANMATLAEFYIGSLSGVNSGVMLTLGTGVGCGVIINGRPYRGGNGIGIEAGHMVIGDNFYDCNCGKNGCFETFASATAIVKYFIKLISDKGISVNHEISSKEIFIRAEAGDYLPLEAVEWYTDYLAKGIVNLINVIDPEVISLGGGVTASGDFLMNKLTKKVEDSLFVKGFPSAKIVYATAGNKAGILGAAFLVKEELNI